MTQTKILVRQYVELNATKTKSHACFNNFYIAQSLELYAYSLITNTKFLYNGKMPTNSDVRIEICITNAVWDHTNPPTIIVQSINLWNDQQQFRADKVVGAAYQSPLKNAESSSVLKLWYSIRNLSSPTAWPFQFASRGWFFVQWWLVGWWCDLLIEKLSQCVNLSNIKGAVWDEVSHTTQYSKNPSHYKELEIRLQTKKSSCRKLPYGLLGKQNKSEDRATKCGTFGVGVRLIMINDRERRTKK